jgi:hypothetical protein
VSTAKAISETDPPPSVLLTTTASVTPADPVAGIDSPDAEPLSGSGDSLGVGVVLGVGLDSLGAPVEAAGSDAVSSPPSSPQAVKVVASARPVTSAARDRVRARERTWRRRGEVGSEAVMVVGR